MPVSVLSGYNNSSTFGTWTGQDQAVIHQTNRVLWSDIQKLRPGQAIILLQGRRIYARHVPC